MPTNKERKQVAAKLRELGNFITEERFFHWDDAVCESWHAIVKTVGVDNGNPYDDHRETCSRLAELIEHEPERTCRKIKKNDPTNKGNWNFHCSRCNCYLRGTDEYCSNCGAKVARDD